jgi:hypothetical protein
MNSIERDAWIVRCAEQLHEQWPRVPLEQLREVADEIRLEHERTLKEPELAAILWLRRGLPGAG